MITKRVIYAVCFATDVIADWVIFLILSSLFLMPYITFLKQNVSGKSGKKTNAKNTSFTTARSYALAA
jgi:hypothetical protein